MFLFGDISWQAAVMWFVVLAALIVLNEISRRGKVAGLVMFIGVPRC